MNEDQRRILDFCIGEWKSLAPLKEQIPYSTLYRVAKDLCGRRLLLHRRKKGYRTTQRGIQASQKERTQVGTLREDKPTEKVEPAEGKRQIASKNPPVNLATIQKLLQLSDKRINSFPSLYPPLQKVPTPTHRAIIELCWAEVCDRKWPVTEDHHFNFLNLGDTFRWKTKEAEFCVHMIGGKDITAYIIELSTEKGRSLWVRKTASGAIIFKRDILEKPFLCLDDYGEADREAKEAARHLLKGRTKIAVENETQMIPCVPMVNLNPQKGDTIFDKTGFHKPLLRRFVPCNLDVIQFPDLKKMGLEALDAAKAFGPLKMEKPTSSCTEYREELIHYYEKLFTEEGQKCIDIEGLLNIARGFTGYGFTPSEAVRYVLYKASLPYHTVGWLRPEWVEGCGKERSVAMTPKVEGGKEKQTVHKKDLQTLKEVIKFRHEYKDELSRLEKSAAEIEELKKLLNPGWEKINQVLVEEGYETPSPEKCEDALEEISKEYTNIQERDRDSLENLKEANNWLKETYIRPLTEAKQLVEAYEKLWGWIWGRISNAKKTSEIPPIREIIEESPLPPIGKDQLKEIIDQKEATLKKKKQLKIEELGGYLREMKELGDSYNQEKMKKLGRDITGELVQLELIKRENDHLRGKDGQSYALDAFNLPKCADTFAFFSWDDACCQGLTLLTGVKHRTLAERMGNFSFSGSRKEEEKEKMPTWGKWALGLGITGVGAYSVYLLFKNRKPPFYIQTQEDLIQVRFLREEGDWLVFQSKDGQKWKLPCNTTRIAVLLKPEYGGQAYWFIRREKENLIVQVDHNDEKIPITQVDKIIYQAPSSEQ